MTLTGYYRNDFTAKDKQTGAEVNVTGYNVYVSRPVDPTKGKGNITECQYVSDRKLEAWGIDLSNVIGKEINVVWNRYGKIDRISI